MVKYFALHNISCCNPVTALTRHTSFGNVVLFFFCLSGCQSASHTQNGALLGSGLGALTGAVIGEQSGNAPAGALLGAAAGGVTGGLIGNAQDLREERDAAIAQAHYSELQRLALDNSDVIHMVQSGLSEDVVIRAIRTEPSNYSVTADDLIQLRRNGVSDAVIQEMQQAPRMPSAPSARSVESSSVPSVGVFVAPRPLFFFGPPRPWRPYPHHFGPPPFRRGF